MYKLKSISSSVCVGEWKAILKVTKDKKGGKLREGMLHATLTDVTNNNLGVSKQPSRSD